MALINCPECAKEISDRVKSCPNCGYPMQLEEELIPPEASPQQVEITGVRVNKGAGKFAVIAATIVGVGAIAFFLFSQITENIARQEYEAAVNTYIDNLEALRIAALSGASEAERLCNLTYKVWRNAIYKERDSDTDRYTVYDGKFVEDFDSALGFLFAASSTTSTVSRIESNQMVVKEVLKDLQNPPEGLDKQYNIASSMYDSYKALTDLAADPSGNLNSFSEKKGKLVDDFVKFYEQLGNQMPAKFPLEE